MKLNRFTVIVFFTSLAVTSVLFAQNIKIISSLSSSGSDDDGSLVSSSGKFTKESHRLKRFHSVSVSNSIDADISFGLKDEVTIEGPSDVLPRINAEVKNSQLLIGMKSEYGGSEKVHVHIVARLVNAVEVSGASKLRITHLRSKRFALEVTGASQTDIDGSFGNVELSLSGGSVATLSGAAKVAKLDVSGGSRASLSGLKARKYEVDASGGSVVSLGKTKEANLVASGGSKIVYTGHPKIVKSEVSGASTIGQNLKNK
jgi:hypothetical protein